MEGLSLICAGLGTIEEDDNGNRIGYAKGEFCLDNLRDLLRFMRRDDPQTREVFKQVCKWNTVSKDLVPIIDYCQDDRVLVLTSVKILVFLTMPIEPTSTEIAQQIEYLWGVKSAITYSNIIPVILSLLEKPLENLDSDSFSDDDWKLVQLVLTLFRNLLAIQDISTLQKAGGSATEYLSIRDRFIELLFEENVMELLLALSQHVGGSSGYFRHDNLLLLETFHYIFKGHNPELIAKNLRESSKDDENAESSLEGLNYIIQEEREKRMLNRMRNLGSSSQFSGTFTRLTLDGSKTIWNGNPNLKPTDVLHKPNKHHRVSKKTAWDHGRLPTMKSKTLHLLHDFIDQFVSGGGYNALMQSVREDIVKERPAIQNCDVVMFFQVAWFVTSFQYYKFQSTKLSSEADKSVPIDNRGNGTHFRGSICGPIAETLNESMFMVLISKWRYAFDALKETNDYTLLSAAGSLLKIMIRQLDLVLKQSSEDSMEPKTARVLLYKLFYDQTEEGMTQYLLNMIRSFDRHKQTKSDLADLVETIHVIFRLMESLQSRGALRVARKSRKKKVKNVVDTSLGKDNANQHDGPVDEQGPGVEKPDGANAGPGAQQSENVDTIREKKLGNSYCNVNEDSNHVETEAETENLRKSTPPVEKKLSHEFDQEAYDSSGDEPQATTNEVDFNIDRIVSVLTTQNILNNLCWLLKFYKSNSVSTNHYIICLLRRICEDLELSPMLYQLSYLITFYDILEEQKSKPCQEHQNIVLFLTSLVRRMLRKMKARPLLFVEVLFSKTRKECHLINAECMLEELGSLRKDGRQGKLNGTAGSSGGEGWVRRSIADALGDDDDDVPMSHQEFSEEDGFSDETNFKVLDTKGEGAFSSSDNDTKEKEIKNKRKRVRALSEVSEQNIKDLYEQFKDQKRCSAMIAAALDPEGKISGRQVTYKLKQLGLSVSKKKSSDTGFRARDVSSGEDSAGHSSDDEPLMSFMTKKKRSKTQKKTEWAAKQSQKTANSPSDDELRSPNSPSDDELRSPNSLSDDELRSPVQSNAFEQSAGVESSELEHAEAGGFSGGKLSHSRTTSIKDDEDMESQEMLDKLGDELADYEDEISEDETQKAPTLRRNSRVIMDLDDDDE